LGQVLTTPNPKTWPCHEAFTIASGLDRSFGTTLASGKDIKFVCGMCEACISPGHIRHWPGN